MGEYQKETIKSIVEEVNRKYFLPDIQRSFVWKPDQIYKLFDSLMREYPISTFLFWKLDKDLIVAQNIKLLRFVGSNEEDSVEIRNYDRDEYFLVLDGQQRLTSFYIALKGKYIERKKDKELYFDVLSGKEEKEDGVLFLFKFFDPNKGNFFITKNNGTIDSIWVNVKRIYEIESGRAEHIRKFVDAIVNSEPSFNNFKAALLDNIKDLYTTLTSTSVINYYPEKEKDEDKILDIFVRTNAGGTKLSYSDLLFSKIKLKWDKAREEFRKLLENVNRGVFDFDNDFILKTCLVIFGNSQTEIRYKIKNLTDTKIQLIRDDWENINKSIQLTTTVLADYARINNEKLLPSHNAVIPLIYFIHKNKIKCVSDHTPNALHLDEIEVVNRWLYRILLTGVFGGQSDNVLYKTKEVIESTNRPFPDTALNKAVRSIGKNLEVNAEYLEEIEYNSANSYLLLFLLYGTQNIKINFNPTYKGETPQQDHIFSQDELKKAGYSNNDINDIGNIRYVSASENNWKRNTPFSDWIKDISPDERKKHFIPEGDWNVSTYKDFIKSRKKLMTEILSKTIQTVEGEN